MNLDWIDIRKYRDVTPGRIDFNPGMNVLLGQNATGKTTLLNLISHCACWGLSRSLDQHLDISFQISVPEIGHATFDVRTEAVEKPPQIDLNPFRSDPYRTFSKIVAWSDEFPGRLEIVQDTKQILWRFGNELAGEAESDVGSDWPFPEILFPLFSKIREHKQASMLFHELLVDWWLTNRDATRFDESLDVFDAMTQDSLSSRMRDGAAKTPCIELAVSKATSQTTRVFFPEKWLMEESKLLQAPALLEIPNALSDVCSLLGFASATVGIFNAGKKLEDDDEVYTFRKLNFLFKRSNDSLVHHDSLSYGQKRLLAFYYYLEVNNGIVIADELVNGLHHGWVETALSSLNDRQSFLTSQNPLLLDYMSFSSQEEARRSFIICSLTDRAHLMWRNMSDDEAKSFYSAYGVGIEQVGEIMRARHLW